MEVRLGFCAGLDLVVEVRGEPRASVPFEFDPAILEVEVEGEGPSAVLPRERSE